MKNFLEIAHGAFTSKYKIFNTEEAHVASILVDYADGGVLHLYVVHADETTPTQKVTRYGLEKQAMAAALKEVCIDGYKLDRGQGFSFLNELGYTVISDPQ